MRITAFFIAWLKSIGKAWFDIQRAVFTAEVSIAEEGEKVKEEIMFRVR